MALTRTTDWQENKTLQECMLHMLTHEIMCDVTLRVGEHQTPIKAHKYMLASRSPVFYTMFEGSLPEEGEISILDIDEETFRIILRFFYADELNVTNENVKDILYCAEKYMLSAVKLECSNLLKATACSSNSAVALLTAKHFHLDELQQTSMDYIEKHTKECLESEHAIKLSKECLEDILQSDYLSCSETDICKFFIKWAKKRCELMQYEINSENLRKVVGTLIPLVRFPVVSKEFFATEVSDFPLLTPSEIVSVFRSHYGVKNTLFQENERRPVSERPVFTLNRYISTSKTWTSRGVEALLVRADKNIWLKGITVFNFLSTSFSSKRSFVIEIRDDKDKLLSATNGSFEISCNDNYDSDSDDEYISTTCTVEQRISTPVKMTANTLYTILIKDISIDTYYGTGCKSKVTSNGVTITFETSSLCTTGTDVEKGQIGGIVFSP